MHDLIDRQAAISAMEDVDWYHIDKDGQLVHGANSKEDEPLYKASDVYAVLNQMPSAQPDLDEVYAHAETEAKARFHAEIVRCKDCKYYQTRQKSGFLPQCCWFDVLTKPNDFCSNGRKENR